MQSQSIEATRGAKAAQAADPVPAWFGTYWTLTGKTKSANLPFTGQRFIKRPSETSVVRLSVSSTVEDLATDIGMSGSLSASFLDYSVDAKATFLRKCVSSSNTLYVSVYCSYRSTQERMEGTVQWTAPNREARSVYEDCGDAYVAGATTGAEFYAVYAFAATSTEEQEKIEGDLKGAGIFDGVKVTAEMQAKFEEMQKTYQSSLTLTEETRGSIGWGGDSTSLVDYALGFAKMVKDSGGGDYVFERDIQPLYALVGRDGPLRTGLLAVADNIKRLTDRVDTRPSLLKRSIAVTANLVETETLLDVYRLYLADASHVQALERNQYALKELNSRIAGLLNEFGADPTRPIDPDRFPEVGATMPVMQFDVHKIDGFGTRSGGDPFEMTDDLNAGYRPLLRGKCRLREMQFRSGNDINGLRLSYDVNGQIVSAPEHGKNWGSWGTQFYINDKDRIVWFKEVFGSGDRVRHMALETAQGWGLEAGTAPGTPFGKVEFFLPAQEYLIGFAGRSGDFIDVIYAVMAKMLAPTFVESTSLAPRAAAARERREDRQPLPA